MATPKTAPIPPWYLPRSRSGMMSAIIAVAVTVRPPPPMPCKPRMTMSQVMPSDMPHSADATMNRMIDPMKSRLRPYMSPNLPASTVAIVWVSM